MAGIWKDDAGYDSLDIPKVKDYMNRGLISGKDLLAIQHGNSSLSYGDALGDSSTSKLTDLIIEAQQLEKDRAAKAGTQVDKIEVNVTPNPGEDPKTTGWNLGKGLIDGLTARGAYPSVTP